MGTYIVAGGIAIASAFIIIRQIRNGKKGKCPCGGNCERCRGCHN